jgi:hypothetical protein
MPAIFTLTLVVTVASLANTGVTTEDRLKMRVALFDYATVPAASLTRARSEMTRIYREIGVDVLWQGADALTEQTLLILIRSRMSETIPQTAVGLASGTAVERGRVAQIFYDRVEQLPVLYVHRPTLLGHVMAHELAHLLLPLESHSPEGLMRARWDRSDLERAQEGRLRFTTEQSRLIRSKVSELAR